MSIAAPSADPRREPPSSSRRGGSSSRRTSRRASPRSPTTRAPPHALVATVRGRSAWTPARLHATSRLDRDVSGVVVFALTQGGRRAPRAGPDEETYDRRYVAIAARAPGAGRGTLGRAHRTRRATRAFARLGGRDPVDARTRYAVVARRAAAAQALLALAPVTGRTHQIRVHAAHAGAPLLGDRAYGGPSRITLPTGRVLEPRRIALHAGARRRSRRGRRADRGHVARPAELAIPVVRAWRRRRGVGGCRLVRALADCLARPWSGCALGAVAARGGVRRRAAARHRRERVLSTRALRRRAARRRHHQDAARSRRRSSSARSGSSICDGTAATCGSSASTRSSSPRRRRRRG